MTEKKEKINLITDKRFKWVLASDDPEIHDGLLIDLEDNARDKFLEETGANDFNIMDYVDYLEESLKLAKKTLEEEENTNHNLSLEVKLLENSVKEMDTLKYSFNNIYWSIKEFIKELSPLKKHRDRK